MNLKIGKILHVFFAVAVIGIVLVLNIFGETLNSNIFTAEVKHSFGDFNGKSISTTANLNWQTENGEKITKTTVKNLPSYMLSVNTSGESREKATFISAPTKALDMSFGGKVYFVIEYAVENEKVEYTVNFTIGDGDDQLVSTAVLKGNSRQLVSFEVGFFTGFRRITELSLAFLSDNDTDGKIFLSGPYYMETDRTYAEDFCLDDAVLSLEAKYTEQGIVIEDSTQKTGFSGRFWRSSRNNVNHLRFFISTGSEGGTMEMRYSYLNVSNGNLTTKSAYVELEDGAENCSYIVPLEYADKIISLSFLFDIAREGGITVHRIEAVEIYSSDNRELHGEISQCNYTSGEGIINIRGNVFHDFLIRHTDYILYCYRLEASETVTDAIESGDSPIASSKMSSEFKMTYKAGRQDKLAAVSEYAIVASNGKEYIEILPSFHVDNKTENSSLNKSNIKGIYISTPSHVAGIGAGVSIVDVYLDKLICERKSGYIYSLGSSHVYFDSDYVHSIDSRVKNLGASGCSVYLRLLINADEAGALLPYAAESGNDTALYSAIEIKTEEAKSHLFSVIDFLTSRYSDRSDGEIEGYIIGKSVNLPAVYNAGTGEGLAEYSDSLADVVEVIALSAAISMPDVRVVVPVSADLTGEGGYDAELFLTSLCNRLDEVGGFDFTVMLESSRIYFPTDSVSMSSFPYELDEEGKIMPDPELVITSNAMAENIEFAEHISYIDKMLSRLGGHSVSAPSGYIYFWEPSSSERSESVVSAYVYMYYGFLFSEYCESFVLSLENSNDSALLPLVKYIDTPRNENGELVDFVLNIFNVSSWNEIIPNYDESKIASRIFTEVSNSGSVSASGEYVLFDFSSSFGILDWFAGDGCTSLSLLSEAGEKFLCAAMDSDVEHSELAYCFDYPEKLDIAPYMNFEFSVGTNSDEKYSVKITVRNGRDILEARDIFIGGEKCSFTVDISSIASKSGIDSVSICVSSLHETVESYDFNLSRVSVFSKTMDSEQLAGAIAQSRSEAKNPTSQTQTGGEQEEPDYEFVFILLAVLVVCVVVAGIYDRNKEK